MLLSGIVWLPIRPNTKLPEKKAKTKCKKLKPVHVLAQSALLSTASGVICSVGLMGNKWRIKQARSST